MKIIAENIFKILFFSIFILSACNKLPPMDDNMLDSGEIPYDYFTHPDSFLVSAAFPSPTPQQLQTPVVIAVHGYSSTTSEWDEFKNFADSNSVKKFYVSRVLLGGHGLSYVAFKNATWEDWQAPIIKEYKKLDSTGFTNISLAGSSTGGPLILEMMYSGKIKECIHQPKHLFLVDPIIIPSSKLLSVVDIIGPFVPYVKTDLDSAEQGHYYQYRPQESLNQLLDIIDLVRKKLEDGITFSANTSLNVYKSERDDAADPVGAVLLYKGIRLSNGEHITVEMENSSLHVFTYLEYRENVTMQDRQLQKKVFNEIANTVGQ
jgi:carboxylesterase